MIFDRVRSHYASHWGEPSREYEFSIGPETYEVYKWDAETHPEGGHTITFEEPVWPGTAMRSLIFTRPLQEIIPDLTLEERAHVVFLQAIPLFESELALKKKDGAESLLAAWRAAGVRFWDPARAALP